ncbi:hypothetical protein GGI21_006718, partial [Coemansia aciculifera]
DYCHASAATAFDRTHTRLLGARRALFDRELYHRLCKEARVLDLGSVRSIPTAASPSSLEKDAAMSLINDALVTYLSHDSAAVRFEWTLQENKCVESDGSSFMSWQSEYYAGLALVMAAMHQRRLHCVVKQHYLGANLASRAHVAATGGRALPPPPPDAFAIVPVSASVPPPPAAAASTISTAHGQSAVTGTATPLLASGSETAGGSGSGSPAATAPAAIVAGADESAATAAPSSGTGASTTFTVARPDLLILAPVLQGMQFAKWQHILSAYTQKACAAWRQLLGEPIEVISHFARSFRTPDGQMSARDANNLRHFCATAATTANDEGGSAAT